MSQNCRQRPKAGGDPLQLFWEFISGIVLIGLIFFLIGVFVGYWQ